MRLLVTGGAGFIGSHLVKYLVHRGHSVLALDNFRTGNPGNLAEVKDSIDFHKVNILESDKLKPLAKDIDGVFHEAALTDVQESFSKPQEYHNINVVGTDNIFKLAKEYGFKVVYASSSSVYGNPKGIPIQENAQREPLNPYGKSKLDGEFLAEKYSKNGVRITGLRYFNVYGEGQSGSYAGVITKFLEKIRRHQSPIIYGDGLQIRDFVYVEDVARANLLAMEKNLDSSFINIGSGKPTSILDLAHMVIGASGLDMKPVHEKALKGDVRQSQANISLAQKLLEWNPQVELKDWLRKVLK